MLRQDPKTSMTLGNTRYSETPVIASQKAARRNRARGGGAASSRSISASRSA